MSGQDSYFAGLSALVETAFPKKCSSCGRVYKSSEDFLRETQNMPNGRSSLKEALEDDGTAIVEVFRNCICGSTLMDEFNSRRDETDMGRKRRKQFDALLKVLQQHGISSEIARTEVLKVMHGDHSDVIDAIRQRDKP